MAIDWGRMTRGVATGYLGAKIANTEANDALNARIIERAGLNFYENTLPKHQESEKNREETYGKVSTQYGKDVAEYMDQNGFIAGNATDYKNIVTLLGSNDGMNETKLKAYLEATSAGTYAERAEKRASKIQDKEKTIMGLTSGSSKIGNMTAELLLKDDETATDAGTGVVPETTTEEVTVPGEMVPGTPIKTMDTKETREVPVESKASKLPTYAEIFGDDTTSTNFFDLDLADREKLQSFVEKAKQTLGGYVYNRHFRENYLPSVGYTYGAVSEGPKENSFVTAARYTINILKSNDPDDPNIDKIKADLKERLGTNDLSPYGL